MKQDAFEQVYQGSWQHFSEWLAQRSSPKKAECAAKRQDVGHESDLLVDLEAGEEGPELSSTGRSATSQPEYHIAAGDCSCDLFGQPSLFDDVWHSLTK